MKYDYNYVVGFAFDRGSGADCAERVILIRKERPVWQKGKLNGVGGKIEKGEFSEQAMSREFQEEAGVLIPADQWKKFCTLSGNWNGGMGIVHFFKYHSFKRLPVRTMTDEEIAPQMIGGLWTGIPVPNLSWLIPMALSFNNGETCSWFKIEEK